MRLYVPQLGDSIRLIDSWTFDLYGESRNHSLFEYAGIEVPPNVRDPDVSWRWQPTSVKCILPVGAILKVDRIYIRKGQKDFSSITFALHGGRTKGRKETRTGTSWYGKTAESFEYLRTLPARQVRFWVKLEDANTIEFEKEVA